MLWFTTKLETAELTEAEDRAFSSPHRFISRDGEKLIYYRLTPYTLAWLTRMMDHASSEWPPDKLFEYRRRYRIIADYAAKQFAAGAIAEAAKQSPGLPVEPSFGWPEQVDSQSFENIPGSWYRLRYKGKKS